MSNEKTYGEKGSRAHCPALGCVFRGRLRHLDVGISGSFGKGWETSNINGKRELLENERSECCPPVRE